jgi:hypothetical protein
VSVGSVGRPKPRSPAGHRAKVSERAGENERAEVGDDRWGRPVSERERESERARAGPRCWAARASASARAGARERAVWLGRTAGKKKNQPDFVFVFLFQINE